MPHQEPQPAPIAQAHLIPRCVDGKFWMLYHVHFEQLLDDFGWFHSRSDAQAKIAELQRVTAPRRFVPVTLDAGAIN